MDLFSLVRFFGEHKNPSQENEAIIKYKNCDLLSFESMVSTISSTSFHDNDFTNHQGEDNTVPMF